MKRSIQLLGLLALGAGLVGTTACDNGGSGGTGGGGTGGTGGSGGTGGNVGGTGGNTGGTGGNTGGTGGNTGGGGNTGDGNDSFAEAVELTPNSPLDFHELDPAPTDLDYFKFDGVAGQAVIISTDAKPDADPYADGYADLVITLFDAAENQIAENDDPIPRNTQDSRLVTVLPATGTYYIRVSEFCLSWPQGPMGSMCYADLADGAYGINVAVLDPMQNSNIQETEPNDGAATASTWEFEPTQTAGTYFASVGWGDFTGAGDVDFYSYTPPGDVDLDVGMAPNNFTGRFNAGFYLFPAGAEGSGSLANVGVVQIIDANTMEVVAELDANAAMDPTFGAQLEAPILADGTASYYIAVNKQGASSGSGYFYFLWGTVAAGNPVEGDIKWDAAQDGNDTIATADSLYVQANADGSTSFFVEGNVDSMSDVDFYQVPNGAALVSASCSGISNGSGATIKLSLVKADGTPIAASGASVTETVAAGAVLGGDMAPLSTSMAGGTFYLKVEKSAQNASVLGDYYRCGVRVYDMM